MNKLVLAAIIRDKPINNDLLVYDTKRKCFVEIGKDDFLKEQTIEIERLKRENQKLNDEIVKFRTQMSQMAKIIKERVI